MTIKELRKRILSLIDGISLEWNYEDIYIDQFSKTNIKVYYWLCYKIIEKGSIMNIELNNMIESFINEKYEADEFCYDFSDKYSQVETSNLERKYIYIYDDINETCSLYDDTRTYDKRLLSEEEFRDRVKVIYLPKK